MRLRIGFIPLVDSVVAAAATRLGFAADEGLELELVREATLRDKPTIRLHELRYWLASAGIHPDRDMQLVVLPPPFIVQYLQGGFIDGFCVGAPGGGGRQVGDLHRRRRRLEHREGRHPVHG